MNLTRIRIISFILIVACIIVKLLKRRRLETFVSPKKRVCVIICGFAPRSFKYVHKTIQNKIIDVLNTKYEVDTFHHSLLSKMASIESNRSGENNLDINNDDVNILNVKELITEYQEDIDIQHYIEKSCGANENHKINPLRELYSEKQAVTNFPIEDYDACVMIWSDAYVIKEINLKHVEDVIENKRVFYSTSYNTWGGVANKFYITSPEMMKNVGSRIDLYVERCKNLKGHKENNEKFLEYSLMKYDANMKYTDMFYIKIRANGEPNSSIKLLDNYVSKREAAKIKKNIKYLTMKPL